MRVRKRVHFCKLIFKEGLKTYSPAIRCLILYRIINASPKKPNKLIGTMPPLVPAWNMLAPPAYSIFSATATFAIVFEATKMTRELKKGFCFSAGE